MSNVIRNALTDFCFLLRNNLTDPAGRPSTHTDTWILDNEGTATFTQNKVTNVRWVKLDGNELAYRDDYSVDYINKEIHFAELTTGSVDANYDYGSTWIRPDFPRLEDVTLPRISITQIGPTQRDLTVGASNIIYEFTEQVDIWTDRKTSYAFHGESCKGGKLREFIADDLVNVIRDKRLWIPQVSDLRISSVTNTVEEITRQNKPVRTLFRARFDVHLSYFYGGA